MSRATKRMKHGVGGRLRRSSTVGWARARVAQERSDVEDRAAPPAESGRVRRADADVGAETLTQHPALLAHLRELSMHDRSLLDLAAEFQLATPGEPIPRAWFDEPEPTTNVQPIILRARERDRARRTLARRLAASATLALVLLAAVVATFVRLG